VLAKAGLLVELDQKKKTTAPKRAGRKP